MSDASFRLDVERREGFEFEVRFDDPEWAPVRMDEPSPLGGGSAPNPVRFLAAAVGNCLAASLLFCLQKARVPIDGLSARVEGAVGRNERGRLRVEEIRVTLVPEVEGEVPERIGRCLEIFEDFCVVTQSVRDGIDVQVDVIVPERATSVAS